MSCLSAKQARLRSILSLMCLAAMLVISITNQPAQAGVIELYEFSSEELQERYDVLIQELRCPKCQNQNLAGSDSAISVDLRREIREMLEEGKSDQQIKEFLTERYGVFVLYKPPVSGNTLLVWLIPFVLLTIGAVVAVYVLMRNRQQAVAANPAKRVEETSGVSANLDEEEW